MTSLAMRALAATMLRRATLALGIEAGVTACGRSASEGGAAADAVVDAAPPSVDGPSVYPACWTALVGACPLSGACVRTTGGSGADTVIDSCYANGVKVSSRVSLGPPLSSVVTRYAADGS